MKLLFIDTETTGLSAAKNTIHQIAGIIEIDGNVIQEFDLKFRPMEGAEIQQEALDIAGLKLSDLRAREMSSQQAYVELQRILDGHIDRYSKKDKFRLVGQNTKFDYDFLLCWMKKHGQNYGYAYFAYHLIDIITATALFHAAGKMALPNMKLGTVAEYFGIELKAHDAMNDIRATREIFHRYSKLISRIDMFSDVFLPPIAEVPQKKNIGTDQAYSGAEQSVDQTHVESGE